MGQHVFISYVREASAQVDHLAANLSQHGIQVWLDREGIAPGQRWRDAIREAIRGGDLFIACFSSDYAMREQTYMNEELTLAIDELRQRPTDRSWFIPVSLDGSRIPDRNIGGGETLHALQSVNLSAGWDVGVQRIIAVATQKPTQIASTAKSLNILQESVTERALRIDRERIAVKRAKEFLWSAAGVDAALTEVRNLHSTLAARANELASLTSSLNIEAETSFPSCVVRVEKCSVVVYWQQQFSNTVAAEHAQLHLLEYDFCYSFQFINRSAEPRSKYSYEFASRDGEYGWRSNRGEFLTSNDITDICFKTLFSNIEQQH